MLRDAELRAEKRLRSRRAETNNRVRFNNGYLRVQPRTARPDFVRVRFLVQAPFSARLPFEMLHDVRDVNGSAVEPDLLERAIEQLARRPDERLARAVFVIARHFADEHDARSSRPLAEDSLCADFPQWTRATIRRRIAQFIQRRLRRNQRLRGFGRHVS